MNPSTSTPPVSTPEADAINKRVITAVRSHQRTIGALTSLAFLLGFLAIAASIVIVSAYFVLYRPKEKQLLREVTAAAEQAKQNPAAAQGTAGDAPKLKFDYPSVQATHTYFLSICIMLTALSVGLLALGTLVLLAVVVLNRRVTLNQINTSLAQISGQLRELHDTKSVNPLGSG